MISNESTYWGLVLDMSNFESMFLGFLLAFRNLHWYIFMLAYISVGSIGSWIRADEDILNKLDPYFWYVFGSFTIINSDSYFYAFLLATYIF